MRRRAGAALVAVALLVGGGALIARLAADDRTDAASSSTSTSVSPTPTSTSLPVAEPPLSTDTTVAATTATPSSAAPTSSASTPASNGVPAVDAVAYAVYDVSSGEFLAEQAADEQLAVGSVMKLLTAHVVMEAGDPTKVVTVPDLQMDPMESAIGLYPGEQLPREVLLRAMLIVSANDAARTLAVDVGGTQDAFVDLMNDAAQRLGLTNTRASNPVGLDGESAYSTAHDMVRLAELLMQDPTFRATVVRPSANLHGQTFPATNDLLTSYSGADGVKTGHTTDAGYCLVGSATRDGRQVIVAVFGSSTDAAREAAASTLLDWAFTQG